MGSEMCIRDRYIALAASFFLVLIGVLSLQDFFSYIDLNVVGLLIGMAVITSYLEDSGLTEWVSFKLIKTVGQNPTRILIMFTLVGSLLSAILDNVSTTLLLAPVAISIARKLNVSSIPYVLGIALGSNLVGAALMIGDPPSMMVASALDLSFIDFIIFQGKPSMFFLILAACPFAALTLKFTTKKYFSGESKEIKTLNFSGVLIKSKLLLVEVLAILALVIFLLSIRNIYYTPLWFPPIFGALLLTLIRLPKENAFKRFVFDVDWKTIVFISCIFVVVGGLVKTGFVSMLSLEIYRLCQKNLVIASTILIWISVLLSAFIDNIPYFAMMIPLVIKLSNLSGMNVYTLMWALLLGGSLGGNCTFIGAAANAVGVGIIEKNEKKKISLLEFMKIGVPFTITAVTVGQILHFIFYILL